MNVNFDTDDLTLLRRVLERSISELRAEISGTESLDWRNALHQDETRMKSMLSRLGTA